MEKFKELCENMFKNNPLKTPLTRKERDNLYVTLPTMAFLNPFKGKNEYITFMYRDKDKTPTRIAIKPSDSGRSHAFKQVIDKHGDISRAEYLALPPLADLGAMEDYVFKGTGNKRILGKVFKGKPYIPPRKEDYDPRNKKTKPTKDYETHANDLIHHGGYEKSQRRMLRQRHMYESKVLGKPRKRGKAVWIWDDHEYRISKDSYGYWVYTDMDQWNNGGYHKLFPTMKEAKAWLEEFHLSKD